MDAIQTSTFDTVITIVFKNKSMGDTLVVWVCADREAYYKALDKLAAMPHVEVIQNGDSHVER